MSGITYMQFHQFLDMLLGSKVMVRLVRSLINREGMVFTVRKLALESGVTQTDAALAVKQLEKFGVLSIRPVGRSYMLSVNKDSYILNSILKPAVRGEQGMMEEFLDTLKKYMTDKSAESVALFGSVAAGKERVDSDIDILVISDDFDAAIDLVTRAQDKVLTTFNGFLSPLVMGRKEFRAKKDGDLVRSILANHILISGKELSELVK
jgi:predicted nucleotidyltransferase